MIDNVTFKQWVSVDRSSLETSQYTADNFIDHLCDKLQALIPTQQALFFNDCKTNLKIGEVLVQADFSENYSFLIQDATQGFHWNNSQATIHPFVIYYNHANEEQHINFVVISDCLKHDTVAVYLFQTK